MQFKQILKDWGLEALILFLFVAVILPYGPGITFDSVSFIQAGDSFWSQGKYQHLGADGDPVFAAHRFPLYPLILSFASVSAKAVLAFQVLLFTASLMMMRSFLAALKAPKYFLLLFATLPIVLCYYCVWTESLYALLFIVLLLYLKMEENVNPIIYLIIIVAFLCLTRMVGVVVAGSLIVAYFLDKRPLRGVTLGAIGIGIIICWTLLGTFYLGETARHVSSHFISLNDLFLFVVELGKWLTPAQWVWIPFITGLCLLIFPILLIVKCWHNREEMGVLFWFLLTHFYAYCLFILLAKSFVDSSIAWGARSNLPLVLNLIALLVVMQSGTVFGERAKEKMRFVFPKVVILVVVLNSYSLWNLRETGVGYNSKDWREFEFTSVLRDYNAEKVFTNDQAALSFHAQSIKNPALLPEKKDLYSQAENRAYAAEMDVMFAQMEEASTNTIIWIRNGITGDVYPSYEELQQHPNLEVLYDDWLCLILTLKE